jgi:parallel beta-helix repeat protein
LAKSFGRGLPVIAYDKLSNTIFVRGGGSVVTLPKIKQALFGNTVALEESKPGEWILRANLYVGKNVTLVVDKRDTKYLKLKSDDGGIVWVRSQGGNMLFSGTKVTSWDESKAAPDLEYEKGRSYITAKSSGRMDIVNSEIAYLGYVGLPKRGGPFGGSYGLSWKITSGAFNSNLLTGSLINSSVHNNYFGIYTFGATGVMVKGNRIFDNVQYGVDPHDDSNNMLISDNIVFENGNHGIIASKRCFNNNIYGNFSYDNKLHGIMLDRNSKNNIVEMNTVYGNVDGITLYDSNDNLILSNNVYGNKQGIRLSQKSSFNYIEKNQVTSNGNGFHLYEEANKNMVIDNKVVNNEVGISMQDASGNIFYASLNHLDNKKDANITTNENENEIK